MKQPPETAVLNEPHHGVSLPYPAATAIHAGTLFLAGPENYDTSVPVFAAIRANGFLLAQAQSVFNPGEPIALRFLLQSESLPFPSTGEVELWISLCPGPFFSAFPGFGQPFLFQKIAADLFWENAQKALIFPSWQSRSLSSSENHILFHYHRYDQDYADDDLWTWDSFQQNTPKNNNLLPIGRDSFGLIFSLDRGQYGINHDCNRIGFMFRRNQNWGNKDGHDRFWIPSLGNEVFLYAGRDEIFTERPHSAIHITDAFLDTPTIIHADFSVHVKEEDFAPEQTHLFDEHGQRFAIKSIFPLFFGNATHTRTVEIHTEKELDPELQRYQLSCEGFDGHASLTPRDILNDTTRFAPLDAKLGLSFSPEESTFRLFAPTATAVDLVLYDVPFEEHGRRAFPMTRLAHGLWEITIQENLHGKFYVYRLDGPGLISEYEAADLYATNTVDSSRRARISSFEETTPDGWPTIHSGPDLSAPVDAVIWEIHVRDLSMSPDSGIQQKGLYLGFTESPTTIPNAPEITTGLDHLVELGVTHIQILPVQDYQNEEWAGLFNWGYITNYFNSPEGIYASNIHDASRVRELKQLVQAAHARDLGVIMDVVYNHTGSETLFNRFVPKYYYRMLPNGYYANGSGCGNDFRSEAPMARKYLVDTLKHWVQEFHIDGFRFDLMALLDRPSMLEVEKELRAIKPDILLYGEPWMAADSPVPEPTDKTALPGTSIGAFNDDFRNAIKGSPEGGFPGFIQNASERDKVQAVIAGSKDLWAPSPSQTINYLTCHDNLVLYDKLKLSCPDASDEELLMIGKLGYFLLLTSQGVPFLHAGCEFFRTKQGDHNSYQSPDAINQIQWARKKEFHPLYAYVRELIALRKAHPIFRLRTNEEISQRLTFFPQEHGDSIQYQLNAEHLPGETWQSVCVLINSHWSDPREFVLPEGEWSLGFDHNGLSQSTTPLSGKISLPGKSAIIVFT